jgi:hypothetical protein
MSEDMQGIMSLPDQSAMEQAAAPTAEQSAAVEQMRSQLSPREVNTEMLGAAEEADPATVAEFRAELQGLELPPEVLDMLNTMVEEILDAPQDYESIRAKYMAQGLEDLLPPEFDATFFGALNMAIDQIRGASPAPMGLEGFAQGGIASLGRNGDTMLAHITPQEAALLRSRGGSGSINPRTGLPEFFSLKGAFKKIGRAVKKFASSTVGKIVIGAALFMVAGPAAASMLNITAPAAVSAVSGFVAGAGGNLLAGGNLKDSLKMGVKGALTAGALTGITQGASAFKAPPAGTGPQVVTSQPSFDAADATRPMQTPAPSSPMGASVAGPQPTPIVAAFDPLKQGLGSTTIPQTDFRFYQDAGMSAAGTGAAAPSSGVLNLNTAYGDARPGFKVGNISAPVYRPTGTPMMAGGFDPSQAARLQAAPPVGAAPSGGIMNLGKPGPQSSNQFRINLPTAQSLPDSMSLPSPEPRGFFGNIKGALTPGDDGIGFKEGLKEAYFPSNTAMSRADALAQISAERGIPLEQLQSLPTNTIGGQEVAARLAELTKTPNMFRQLAPLAITGLGIAALGGGFEEEEVKPPEGFEDFMSGTAGQRLLEKDPSYNINYGGVNTVATAPQYSPYVFTPPRAAAKGGSMDKQFPRKTGPINGPGTGTSDDIPAMLSDGEFVFTAKAVRGMGNGSRRAGAKKMYALMRKLEGRKNG